MDLPKAGDGIMPTAKQVEILAEQFDHANNALELMYMQGFLAALVFPIVPKETETYGFDLLNFARNDYNNTLDRLL